MDKESDHFMAKEYCFFNGNHKRCRGYVTLGCYVYHPLLGKIIRLCKRGSKCGRLRSYSDILDNIQRSPLGWCADEAGSKWEGLFRVFGDVCNRIVSCVFHYQQSVNQLTSLRSLWSLSSAHFLPLISVDRSVLLIWSISVAQGNN